MSLYTALITPFTVEGEFDKESFVQIVKEQFENKVDGIVLFGSTGEAFSLETQEKFDILNTLNMVLVDYPEYKEKIILGFAGSSTQKVMNDMRSISVYEFKNYMLSSPMYCKPTQEGIYQHYSTIMKKFSDKNFMIYNIPSRTGVNISSDTIKRICEDNPNYIGVKEASGSLDQAKILIDYGIPVFSGDDSFGYETVQLGGRGLVSVLSNWLPFEMKQTLTNEKLHTSLSKLYKLVFIESNPVPIKYFMRKYGLINSETVRLPLVDLSDESKSLLDSYKLKEHIDTVIDTVYE